MCIEKYKNMCNAFIHPNVYFKKLKKTGAKDGIIYTLLGILVPAVLAFIFAVAGMSSIAAYFHMMGLGTAVGIVAGVIALIVLLIVYPIGMLIDGFILWIFAKIFGLKKDIGNFIGVFGIIAGLNALLAWIPWVGWLVPIYSIYLFYVMLKQSMDMPSNKAVWTIVAVFIVGLIIAVALVMLVGVGMMALMHYSGMTIPSKV